MTKAAKAQIAGRDLGPNAPMATAAATTTVAWVEGIPPEWNLPRKIGAKSKAPVVAGS
jgi:hypothetical protein